MLVAQWDAVHPWPHGAVGGPYEYFYQYLIDYYGDVFDVSVHGYSPLLHGSTLMKSCIIHHMQPATLASSHLSRCIVDE